MTTLCIDRKDVELRVFGDALEFHEPVGRLGLAPQSPNDAAEQSLKSRTGE